MDYLDLMSGTGYQTYRGEFIAEIASPTGCDQQAIDFENPVPFYYEPMESTRKFGFPIQNLRDTKAEDYVLKTKSKIFYGRELKGFVKLQNGEFYEVISCTIDRKAVSRQSAEYVPIPVGADYIVTLNRIDEPFHEPRLTSSAVFEGKFPLSFTMGTGVTYSGYKYPSDEEWTEPPAKPVALDLLTPVYIKFTKTEGTFKFTHDDNATYTSAIDGNTIVITAKEPTKATSFTVGLE